jgi:hypothetical protein
MHINQKMHMVMDTQIQKSSEASARDLREALLEWKSPSRRDPQRDLPNLDLSRLFL